MQSIVYMFHLGHTPYSRLEARRIEQLDIFKAGDFVTIGTDTYAVTEVFNRYDVVTEKMIITVLVRTINEEEQALLWLTNGER